MKTQRAACLPQLVGLALVEESLEKMDIHGQLPTRMILSNLRMCVA